MESASKTVTAVIPTYRRPRLLERAVKSVLAQTHRDVRVRIYDNASGDETESVARRLAGDDRRVSYHCHAVNIGATKNFQFGMDDVSTPFFSCLSDDDVLFPGFYAEALAAFDAAPDTMMSIGSTLEFTPDGRFLYAPLALWPRCGRFDPPGGAFAMLDNRHATWTGIVFRREVVEHVGSIDAEVGPPADLDFELRVACRYPFVVSFAPSAAYLNHASSVSAGEDASVIAGYRRIASKIAHDERLATDFRSRIAPLLQRQMRRKLIEIVVKGLCADNLEVAAHAAGRLSTDFAGSFEARTAVAAYRLCSTSRFARSVLRSIERARLRLRARRSEQGTRRHSGTSPADFVHYLTLTPGLDAQR
ncbi:MAG TPA: glycosyltransferase family 2 protein [Gemmatimonadaceae bacterium]|nr:glycosyltransferase family 2 protein [Gemmatimonadaceae bacterium]